MSKVTLEGTTLTENAIASMIADLCAKAQECEVALEFDAWKQDSNEWHRDEYRALQERHAGIVNEYNVLAGLSR